MDCFAKRLYEIRKESGLSQHAVADMLGIRESSYQNYEYGRTKPKIELLIQLGNIFHVSLDYLCARTNEKKTISKKFSEDIKSILVATLQNERKKKELLQREVAVAVGISTSVYQKYELGQTIPSYASFMDLVEFYKFSIDNVFGN